MQSDTIRLGLSARWRACSTWPDILKSKRGRLRSSDLAGPPPPRGAIVGAVITTRDGGPPNYEIAGEVIFAFLEGSDHGWVDAIEGGEVRYKSPTGDGLSGFPGSADAWIDNALASIQKCIQPRKLRPTSRQSRTHRDLCKVKEIKDTKEGGFQFSFSPRLTLAGEFDCGGTPRVVVIGGDKENRFRTEHS